MKKGRLKNYWKKIQNEIKQKKVIFAVYSILRVFVLVTLVLQFFNGNYENVFLCVLTLLLLIVPTFIQMEFKIELPTTLEVIILFFIFAAEILGEIQSFYLLFPMWDTILHTLNGFLAAAIGFSLVTLLNDDNRLQFYLSPLFVCVVAFCFSMTIGVLWEFFEFGLDRYLGKDCQKDTIVNEIRSVELDPTKSNIPIKIDNIHEIYINGEQPLELGGYLDIGLIDTMKDLMVNFIGAVVFSVLGFFYLKYRDRAEFIYRFIPQKKEE